MKPYGKKPQLMIGKVQGHTCDNCDTCTNKDWKISKSRERNSIKEELYRIVKGETNEK